jgi:hypothetical protein
MRLLEGESEEGEYGSIRQFTMRNRRGLKFKASEIVS